MRLSTVSTPRGTRAAVASEDSWVLLDEPDVGALLRLGDWRTRAEEAMSDPVLERLPLEGAELRRPIPAPAKIVCCGLNYADHIAETGRETPQFPTLFAKFADTLTDPTADILVSGSEQVDWEAELVVVVGDSIRNADAERAAAAIAGYTVANDISMRDWQSRTLQWFQGKAFDGTTPLGPVVVTADEIDPKRGVVITASIDGEEVQRSNTRELVFDAADLVSYVSQFTQLSPGDLILTGTPSGVGLGRTPRRWLQDGELLTTQIEGIGELRNRIRLATP